MAQSGKPVFIYPSRLRRFDPKIRFHLFFSGVKLPLTPVATALNSLSHITATLSPPSLELPQSQK
ncbi:hypothetical protein CCACVL1_08053 [Corchorus capsularis]|uniref:Uncharacterized protein n=1 Tax=Corchorus capsularis TaxID=210143 RepID=A0A1R3J2G7_COCAP|nr:hypothetical protein CCACVL1_08053 [Corchorus capsularis]